MISLLSVLTIFLGSALFLTLREIRYQIKVRDVMVGSRNKMLILFTELVDGLSKEEKEKFLKRGIEIYESYLEEISCIRGRGCVRIG